MLLFTRRLAGRLRIVLRRTLNLSTHGPAPPIDFDGGPDGLRVRCRASDAAVEFRLAGQQPDEHFAVPFQMLSDVEGRKEEPVEIRLQEGKIAASWRDGSVPQMVQHDSLEIPADDWPPLPDNQAENPPGLLKALDDACQTTDPASSRYALGCVKLQGASGKILATDGRQLLVQSGFSFPWEDDVLLPTAKIFGSPQLPQDEPMLVGRSDDWLTLRVGPWTFWRQINKEGRFPKVEDHVQRPEVATASFPLSDADCRFLIENLPRLPGDDAMNYPVTVDLNGHVAVRARGEGQTAPTELVFSGAAITGEPIRFNTNRHYLARAVRLGFDRLYVFSPKAPVLACDEKRNFVWAVLDADSSIAPAEDAVRIPSPDGSAPSVPTKSTPKRQQTTMTTSTGSPKGRKGANGSPRPVEAKATDQSAAGLVEQAEAVRSSLREALAKAGDLITSLRQHHKRTKTVRAALASLRQLEKVGT